MLAILAAVVALVGAILAWADVHSNIWDPIALGLLALALLSLHVAGLVGWISRRPPA